MALTEKDFEAIGRAIAPLLKKELAPLQARIKELESTAIKYRGTWSAAVAYPGGSCVTADGSLWVCGRDSASERPGTIHSPWTLVVKNGAAK